MSRRLAMVIDAARCIHCAACMVSCKAENAVADGHSRNRLFETEAGAFPRLTVSMAPAQCMQCDAAPCIRLCPTGATFRGAGGVVMIEPADCIGCRYCVESCPYDARYFDEASGTVDKCMFCLQRVNEGLEPACVSTCPTRTRTFGDLADPSSAVSVIVAAGRADIRLPEAGTQPKVYYLRGEVR